MSTTYPTSKQSFTNPLNTDYLNDPDHAGEHADINDTVEALQTKAGITNSTDTTSLDYKVRIKSSAIVAPSGGVGDYICDGTDDDVQIQAALTANDYVFLREGNYSISTTINITGEKTLQGAGSRETTLKLANGANTDIFSLSSWAQEIKDLEIDGNKANNASVGDGIKGTDISKCTLTDLTIKNCHRGVNFDGNSLNNFFTRLWVNDCKLYGVNLNTDSFITLSFVGSNGKDIPADYNSSNIYIVGWDALVSDCHLWDAETGIYGNWVNDTRIVNNTIEEHQKDGILMAGRCNGSIISNNYIEDNSLSGSASYDGISIDGINAAETAERNVITGNRIGKQDGTQALHRYGIYIGTYGDNNVVSGNNCQNGYQTGAVFLTGSNSTSINAEAGQVKVNGNFYSSGVVKTGNYLFSSGGDNGIKKAALWENYTDGADGLGLYTKITGSEFKTITWEKESAWTAASAAADKDVKITFSTLLNNSASDIVTLLSSGKVGIGDTAPGELLDVAGNINATGVIKIDDTQVISNRVIDARCDDAINSGDATTDGVIDALRDAMITHGLIAAS